MIRIFFSCFFSLIAPFLAWLAGFDFDERGFYAFMCGLITIFIFILSFSYPGKYPGEKH